MTSIQEIDPAVEKAIYKAVEAEPLARTFKMRLLELRYGFSLVEMPYDPDSMANMYARAHGGAIFSLIDEAFETASQTGGSIAVALNVNVTYISSPAKPTILRAEATEISYSRKTASYDIKVTDDSRNLVATCQAVAYRTGKPLGFV
ncbi:MAG: PaaI family thioesterase [Desulfobacteraceae bacterium]|nr:PaaI family thioesterase [Desulfobacteraceae bacterium]MCF8093835.1 PaaI family thioesterase [Desulfobacteraceae bacterium]